MEAIKSIPKVLQGIEDIHHSSNSNPIIEQYKQNVKEFIKTITIEVSIIIDQYETKISQLKQENRRLKQKGNTIRQLPLQTAMKVSPDEREAQPYQSKFIHSGKKIPNLQMMQTAKSHMFTPYAPNFDDDIRLSAVLSKYKRIKDEDNNFPVQLINPQPGQSDQIFHNGKSHFQIKSNRKKQREQQLRNFLYMQNYFRETGKKNMSYTTKRFLESIGRNRQNQQVQEKDGKQSNRDNSDSSLSNKRSDEAMNKSLGNICNSLDNSFISKRARSNKKKKSNQIEEELKRKQKHEQDVAKMMKNKGIRNLLLRLRENVEASPNKAPEIIRSSKLISCGPAKSTGESGVYNLKNNSKVMINPVPVDIAKKSMVSKRDRDRSSSPQSPTKKPQSILKQSTRMTNNEQSASPKKSILKQASTVLSKSISGISAIQFAD